MWFSINFRNKIAPKIRPLLKTFDPQIMKNVKNIERRQKLSDSYKKKEFKRPRYINLLPYGKFFPKFYLDCGSSSLKFLATSLIRHHAKVSADF